MMIMGKKDIEDVYDPEGLDLHGEEQESIYSDDGRAGLIDDDEISAEEDAFMQGYNEVEETEDSA